MISEFIGYSSIFMAYFVTAMCFLMMQRYSCTVSLGKAFMFLGLAFMFYGSAETVWYVLDYQEIEPYQNYPDIFYVGYYVFSILHVIETLRYFTTKGEDTAVMGVSVHIPDNIRIMYGICRTDS